jgi:hypothetical protein
VIGTILEIGIALPGKMIMKIGNTGIAVGIGVMTEMAMIIEIVLEGMMAIKVAATGMITEVVLIGMNTEIETLAGGSTMTAETAGVTGIVQHMNTGMTRSARTVQTGRDDRDGEHGDEHSVK